ncbi:MAG: methyltransferase [Oligoflexia bacterium]|nr:methyltransferase [Oligoflexia bacterium]MBF0364464.1 methyltransferase [Oligoflexia bacterium]
MIKDYISPDFYRFNQDSIMVAKLAAKYLLGSEEKVKIKTLKILDLGAGNGVIGIELARSLVATLPTISLELHFCELQPEFIPFIEENCHHFANTIPKRIFNCSFSEFDGGHSYDIIVSNPPYFSVGAGKISPKGLQRNICRFFVRDSMAEFLQTIDRSLAPHPRSFALFSTRLPQVHGTSLVVAVRS